MMEHTLGPLTIHGPSPGKTRCDDGGDYAILDVEGRIIGEAICYTERSYIPYPAKENAQLWAAAPETKEQRDELLEACQLARLEMGLGREFQYVVPILDAAILKATRSQP